MGPQSYMRFVMDQNIMRRMTYFWNCILQSWDTHVPLKACDMYLYALLSELQVQEPLEETSTSLSFLIMVLLFQCGIQRKHRTKSTKIDYLYKLLIVFGVVSKIACGMFPTVGKVTNAVRITGHAILYQHASNCH
jgi:hypothetical protein